MKLCLTTDKEYKQWLADIKDKVRQTQIRAAVKVNAELLNFYWELGADIVEKQAATKWGDGFLSKLSQDLMAEFPDIKGFSERNIKYIRQWFLFYGPQKAIGQQPAAQLEKPIVQQLVSQIPWGHNLVILSKIKDTNEALFYVQKTIQNNWSRAVLIHHIESDLYAREGKAITNFKVTLPEPQSDLAHQTLKDPYSFDFLTLREKHDEKELEDALIDQVTRFLLEMGAGFSYISRQYRLEINGDEFFVDLLFYHIRLHCYVVVELKAVKFKPEFAGKLNFYVSAVDGILKTEQDNPTIGILICKSKNKTVVEYALKDIHKHQIFDGVSKAVVEYALKDIHKPIGVSEYTITKNLPEEFKSSLPSLEEIEAELGAKE